MPSPPIYSWANIIRFRAPGWSWQNWVSNKRVRAAADDEEDFGDDGDIDDTMMGGSSRKKGAVSASGWQGWSKWFLPLRSLFMWFPHARASFAFMASSPSLEPLFEPIIGQHKDAPRASFVLPVKATAAVAARGFGSQWTTAADSGLGVWSCFNYLFLMRPSKPRKRLRS
jgi:hypothetical protein